MKTIHNNILFFLAVLLLGCAEPENTKIVGWGDSMMRGSGGDTSILETLSKELGVPHENFAVGGLKSSNIAILQGGTSMEIVLKNQEIKASSPTEVTFYSREPINFQTKQSRQGNINGINGFIQRLHDKDNKRKTTGYTFTATDISEDVKTADTVIFQFEDALKNRDFWTIIWAGRNDSKSKENVYRTKDNIQGMIDYLGKSAKEHVLVLSICNGIADKEDIGRNAHTNIMRLNKVLKEAFGERFVDVRSYMVNKAIYDMKMTPTTQDLEDMKKDCIPRSFLKDNVHFNTLGYEATGKYVAQVIKEKGWLIHK